MAKQLLRLKVDWINPDPNQYKPHNVSVSPAYSMYVEVEVDEQEVIEIISKDEVTLTPKGLAQVTLQLAQAWKEMNLEYQDWTAELLQNR